MYPSQDSRMLSAIALGEFTMLGYIVAGIVVVAAVIAYVDRVRIKAQIESTVEGAISGVRAAVRHDIDVVVADVKEWAEKTEAKPAEIIAQIEARIKQIL